MAEIAAHLVDHVFPPLPVRQWVLSLPKRLRYFLKTNPAAVSAVLHILLRVIQQALIERCPNAPENARLGAVGFIHRFGDALNEHIHFHVCVIDALFYRDETHGALRIVEVAEPPAGTKPIYARDRIRGIALEIVRRLRPRVVRDTDVRTPAVLSESRCA